MQILVPNSVQASMDTEKSEASRSGSIVAALDGKDEKSVSESEQLRMRGLVAKNQELLTKLQTLDAHKTKAIVRMLSLLDGARSSTQSLDSNPPANTMALLRPASASPAAHVSASSDSGSVLQLSDNG